MCKELCRNGNEEIKSMYNVMKKHAKNREAQKKIIRVDRNTVRMLRPM